MTTDAERREQERQAAIEARIAQQRDVKRPEQFLYDRSQDAYWDTETMELLPDRAVDAGIPRALWRVTVDEPEAPAPGAERNGRPPRLRETRIPPSRDIRDIDFDRWVETSSWWPGKPSLIHDVLISKHGPITKPGYRAFNTYLPPPAARPDLPEPTRWLDHVRKLWPDPTEHNYFFDYCAHMVQHPDVKANSGIVLSGAQGIGKDAALYPVRVAIGTWNVQNIEPDDLFSPFQPWKETLMLVVNEVRPTRDEFHATSMYNSLKMLTAAPPEVLRVNDKNVKARYVVNVMRVFLTTNDLIAMYIPDGDRRLFVLDSRLAQHWHLAEGQPTYFVDMFRWFDAEGGAAAVASWLARRDLAAFDPKSTPERTQGWQSVASSWSAPDDGVTFALERLGHPDVLFSFELADPQFDFYDEVMGMLKSQRKITQRMFHAGYEIVTPQQGERWSFRSGDKVFRSRLAFYKRASTLKNGDVIVALMARGRELVKAAVGTTSNGIEPQVPVRH